MNTGHKAAMALFALLLLPLVTLEGGSSFLETARGTAEAGRNSRDPGGERTASRSFPGETTLGTRGAAGSVHAAGLQLGVSVSSQTGMIDVPDALSDGPVDRIWKMLGAYCMKVVGGLSGEGAVSQGFLWTRRQLAYLVTLLKTLPVLFSKFTKEFQRVETYAGKANILGYVYSNSPRVYLTNMGTSNSTYLSQTIVHEMAHCWYFNKANAAARALWDKTFWPSGTKPVSSSVTAYGNTNKYEDFAESARFFWERGPTMKSQQPARYAFMKKHVFISREYSFDMVLKKF